MTDLITRSQSLVRTLADLFAARPQVEAVALGGSRSGAVADAMSDIDLYVYTRAEIPLDERKAVIASSGGASRADVGLTYWGPGDGWFDAESGIEVDIVYFDADWMTSQIQRVMREHQASLGYTTSFARTVHQSHIVFDRHGWFGELQAETQQVYPEVLRRNIIEFNHPVLRDVIPAYFHQLEKAVQRKDWVSVNHRVAALLASYFDIVFALNRVLHPGEKRLVTYALRECALLPVDMASDVESILTTSPATDSSFLVRIGTLLDRLDQLLKQHGFAPRR